MSFCAMMMGGNNILQLRSGVKKLNPSSVNSRKRPLEVITGLKHGSN